MAFGKEIKVRVPAAMRAELETIAAADSRAGTTVSDIARDAIGEFLARRELKPKRTKAPKAGSNPGPPPPRLRRKNGGPWLS